MQPPRSGVARVGCSGWAYRDWRGPVYPAEAPAREWFGYYAQRFATVELNTTFYRLPTPEAVDGWRKGTPSRFVFAVKGSRYLTHVKRLKEPVHADRVNLEEHTSTKRFGSLAVENGAVMVLGHMGLCGGFPELYPMAEHVLDGLSVGEAYQRVMNALIGNRPLPGYYLKPASRQNNSNDAANTLLLILWADPALVPIASN